MPEINYHALGNFWEPVYSPPPWISITSVRLPHQGYLHISRDIDGSRMVAIDSDDNTKLLENAFILTKNIKVHQVRVRQDGMVMPLTFFYRIFADRQ